MVLSQKTVFAILFFSTIAVRILFHALTDFTADDALTTFRYAENIVAGHGFVYNPGEKVMGTTTPLFTFILAVLLLFRLSPLNAAMLVSIICSGLTTIVVYRFAQRLRFTKLAVVPALIYMLWPRSITADTSGLESALFTLLIITTWYYQHRNRWFYGVALATLASVTRPEGYLLLAIVLLYNCRIDSRNTRSYLLIPSVIIVPWFLFTYLYFGSVIPTSITGKLALYAHLGTLSYWEKLSYILAWHNPLGWMLSAAAVAGAWWLHKKQNFGKLEIVWLLAMIAFFTFSRTALFFWYAVPVYPLYLLFACAALPMMWERLSLKPAYLGRASVVLSVLICIPLLFYCNKQKLFYEDYGKYLNEVHRAIGLYLRVNAEHDDTAAARYIGNTGYYSGLKIVDRDGIVTPAAAAYNKRGDYIGFILDFKPNWVVAAPTRKTGAFAESPRFLKQYELVESFGWEDRVRHNLYRLKSTD